MSDPSRLTQEQLDEVLEAMLAMKHNVVTIGASHGDMADVLVRGDASIGVGGWAYQVLIAREKGVELAIDSPSEDGTFFWSDSYAIAVDAPNIDNAYGFIDFMTGAEQNAALATELASGCVVEAALDLMDPAVSSMFPYEHVRTPGGGILGTQVVVPPQDAEGEVVGASAWVEAWQIFKVS